NPNLSLHQPFPYSCVQNIDHRFSVDEAKVDESKQIHFAKVEKRVCTTGGGSTGTVRNLCLREDTTKYLWNLNVNSAHYDPKTRSMREDPLPVAHPNEKFYEEAAFPRSKYEEDILINNHATVWGYKCCMQTILNSYCTGAAGIEAAETANMKNFRPKKVVEPGDGDHVRDGSTFKILHQLNIRGPKDEEKMAVSGMYLRWPLEENNERNPARKGMNNGMQNNLTAQSNQVEKERPTTLRTARSWLILEITRRRSPIGSSILISSRIVF
ncbi:hypothetical protein KIW84_061511, partial [Lathyrus oleraceus]